MRTCEWPLRESQFIIIIATFDDPKIIYYNCTRLHWMDVPSNNVDSTYLSIEVLAKTWVLELKIQLMGPNYKFQIIHTN